MVILTLFHWFTVKISKNIDEQNPKQSKQVKNKVKK